MPFPSQGLDARLMQRIDAFIAANDFVDLYRSYEWGNDSYDSGFVSIFALEGQLTGNEREFGVTLEDVRAVATWGRLRNPDRLGGPTPVLERNSLTDLSGLPQSNIETAPEGPIQQLDSVRGLGPTYKSKVLRFALPSEYGAIDTRCVRVFGQGDPASSQDHWISLTATLGTYKGRPNGWHISSTQSAWPSSFGTWTNILRYVANELEGTCPHTRNFIESGLRQEGVWTCADVEMALFTYASRST